MVQKIRQVLARPWWVSMRIFITLKRHNEDNRVIRFGFCGYAKPSGITRLRQLMLFADFFYDGIKVFP